MLLEFKKENGHCNVPHGHEMSGAKLGFWLTNQRNSHRQGKLEPSRVNLLEEAGIMWHVHQSQWDQNHCLLLEFKKENGHCNVPYAREINGVKLGMWLANQKQNHKQGKLESSRVKLLEEAGVVWLGCESKARPRQTC